MKLAVNPSKQAYKLIFIFNPLKYRIEFFLFQVAEFSFTIIYKQKLGNKIAIKYIPKHYLKKKIMV